MNHATGKYVIVQDADLELDPAEYHRLLAPLEQGVARFVIGCRTMPDQPRVSRFHWLGIRVLNLAVRKFYGQVVCDEACGFKVARTEDFRRMELESNGFECCPEIVAKACRLGLQFQEVPVSYSPRSVCQGKKIQLRDGLKAIRTLARYRRWSPRPK